MQKQCTAFVAYHADHLDSLEDFPDDVGRSIWTECCSNKKLHPEAQTETRESILKVTNNEQLNSSFCHEIIHTVMGLFVV